MLCRYSSMVGEYDCTDLSFYFLLVWYVLPPDVQHELQR